MDRDMQEGAALSGNPGGFGVADDTVWDGCGRLRASAADGEGARNTVGAPGTESALVTELTVTNFVFRRIKPGGPLHVGLMWHPRFEEWLPPCGHVEDETLDQAAVRETLEELGCRVQLLSGPALPVPEGFPHSVVAGPFWIVEMNAGPDNHTRAPHRHQDHVFASVHVDDVQKPETQVRWLTESEVADAADIPEDSRLQAKHLFPIVEQMLPVS
jgi:8-oxo-dGTP pyrophosphatase MutT (NUDIX family)